MAQEEEKEVNEQNEEVEEVEEQAEEEQVGEQPPVELPPVTFETYVFELYNMARMYMGVRDPESGNWVHNLPIARHTIDILGMIQEKTKGNLTAPEGNLMENILYELRMSYLHSVKQAEEEAKKEPEAEEEVTEPEEEAAEEESNTDN